MAELRDMEWTEELCMLVVWEIKRFDITEFNVCDDFMALQTVIGLTMLLRSSSLFNLLNQTKLYLSSHTHMQEQ